MCIFSLKKKNKSVIRPLSVSNTFSLKSHLKRTHMVLSGGRRFAKFQSKSQLFTTVYIVVKSCEKL